MIFVCFFNLHFIDLFVLLSIIIGLSKIKLIICIWRYSMKIKIFVICMTLLLSAVFVVQAKEKLSWNDYKEKISLMMDNKKIDEVLMSLKKQEKVFPEKEFELLDLTRACFNQLGDVEKEMELIAKGNEKGYFFWLIPRQEVYDKFRNCEWFINTVNRNNALRDSANKTSIPLCKVDLPEKIEKNKKYPLILFLHGGNQSIEKCAGRWKPEFLGKDKIIVYLQSSWIVATNSYRWNIGGFDLFHQGTALNEITDLYKKIESKYPVDTNNVIICGFSQGATLAVSLALNQQIPCNGVIAGCPFNSVMTVDQVKDLLKRNVRLAIFTGDKDFAFKTVQKSCELLKSGGVNVLFTINKDKGHEFPDDFENYLKKSMVFIEFK